MVGVRSGRLRPKWPEDAPHSLVSLSEACWAQDPTERPTFVAIIDLLNKADSDLRMERLAGKGSGSVTSSAYVGSSDSGGSGKSGGGSSLVGPPPLPVVGKSCPIPHVGGPAGGAGAGAPARQTS